MQRIIVSLSALMLLSAPALADTKIPGTKISYKLKDDAMSGTNASMVFIDATSDLTGKTYLAFVCDLGEPFARLYTQVTLGTTGNRPATYFSANGGRVKELYGAVREDGKTGKPTVLDMNTYSTTQVLQALLMGSNVSMRVERQGFSAVTYTFPASGFTEAWKAIQMCD